MLLDDENYKRCFSGFALTDCAVRGRDTFYFVTMAEYDPDEPPPPDVDRLTRVNICFAAKPMDQRWKLITFKGFDALKGAVARSPLEQFVGVDRDAQVVSFGSGKKDHEKTIPHGPKGPIRGGVRRVRTIDGKAHVSSGYRGLARRDGLNQWVSLCDTLVFKPSKAALPTEYGFEDFGAFDPDDIYCVGGEGDVWHRGAAGWTQLDFPTNQELTAVCCAGDGFVYIGAQSGSVWKGRDDTWRLIHRGDMTLPFRDMVWYGDRVYCTSDHGLWEIQGDRLREANVPDEIKVCSGNLDVGDGVMLLAGVYGAAYLEGDTWTRIYDTFTFTGLPPGTAFPPP
ncbi:MAG TPA: hypothetical protein PLN91_08710 [Rhodanobacteraceae bacterium]|nr:hypothetical protein [Rhodanobacteraceae bacterium]